MKSINVKECRLLEQWANTTLASYKWGDLIQFEKDKEIIIKALDELKKSELYQKVWGEIQAKAEELVKEKCEPEWNRISEEMKPLGEERNNLWKEKAASKENNDVNWWTEEKENRLAEIDKQMSELSAEYQKVTDNANAELNEFKEKRINEEQGGCFFLEDEEYDIVWKYAWRVLPSVEE